MIEVYDFEEPATLAEVGAQAEQHGRMVKALCLAWLYSWTRAAPHRVREA